MEKRGSFMEKYHYIQITNFDDISEEQLTAAIEQNSNTYNLMSREVENLHRVSEAAKAQIKKPPTIIETEKQSIEELPFDADFEEEIEYYYSELRKLTLQQLEQELTATLPARSHYEYERILRRLQAELLKECKEIRDFIATEPALSQNDLKEFQIELNSHMAKLAAISAEINRKQETVVAEPPENNLIFVPTSSGNIRILDDVAGMDIEHARAIAQLITSIKDGTFKQAKCLSGAGFTLNEVRDLNMGGRVTFMRLNSDTYAIIGAFIKKTNNNSGYRKILNNHAQAYYDVEQQLKENATNPDFLSMHKLYEQELFRKLSPPVLEHPAVHTKGGK